MKRRQKANCRYCGIFPVGNLWESSPSIRFIIPLSAHSAGGMDLMKGGVYLFPRKFTLANYHLF